MSGSEHITAGFIPLLDAAILIAAREKGLAAAEGVALSLVRETSWANIRDRMAVGHFEVAHSLAPMPIASNLGLSPLSLPLIAPFALGLGGNAVTVSQILWQAMRDAGAGSGVDPQLAGHALSAVVARRARSGRERLRFGVVHPHSGHNLELRYWLAACGVNPEHDIEIVIVPPPFMADALAAGRIDGFCVGEPWNSVAVAAGQGRIATVKAAIWRSSPEKVLGVRQDWAEANSELLARLIRALYRAAAWCSAPENSEELAAILSRPSYLDQPVEVIARPLTGRIVLGAGETVALEDFFVPFERAATFPWQSHALWFYSQMVRWKQISHSATHAAIARNSYRPDIYRAALRPLEANLPGANSKVEGALTRAVPVGATAGALALGPDGFFDGRVFDPDGLDSYIDGQI